MTRLFQLAATAETMPPYEDTVVVRTEFQSTCPARRH